MRASGLHQHGLQFILCGQLALRVAHLRGCPVDVQYPHVDVVGGGYRVELARAALADRRRVDQFRLTCAVCVSSGLHVSHVVCVPGVFVRV